MFRTLLAVVLFSTPAFALVGGERAGRDIAPHLIMITGQTGFCSGVVIARDMVLTAAHCVHPGKAYRVLYFDGDEPVLIQADRILKHPKFDPSAYKRRAFTIDFALLKLKSALPAQFSPASFPTEGENGIPGARYRIAGFGPSIAHDPKSAGIAREAVMIGQPPVSDVQLRLEAANGATVGACQGDSGGPVFRISEADGTPIPPQLIGIIASARECGGRTGTQLLKSGWEWLKKNQ